VKSRKHLETKRQNRRKSRFGWGLAIVVGASLFGAAGFTTAHAQSTSGAIFGQAPAGATVTVQSTSGLHRHIIVKSSGRYAIRALPLGVYTATLQKEGAVVDTRPNIRLSVGGGAEVDFACPHDQCAEPEGGDHSS
jgi:hypothetical protein